VEGSCEHGNERSGSVKCWEVREYLHNLQLLKKAQPPERERERERERELG
jgi:hypothetical protein